MIDNSMIPDEGRDLQCGSCNHIWFYKTEEQNNEVLKLDEEIESEEIEKKIKKKKEKIEEKEQLLEETENIVRNIKGYN